MSETPKKCGFRWGYTHCGKPLGHRGPHLSAVGGFWEGAECKNAADDEPRRLMEKSPRQPTEGRDDG